ncbi:efflux RND transporter permease subunit [Tropicibacter sp. R16_0]|uniref:efflux RND transporter permease subunit n=1 Tax=Tropicibacter sp. R16_0 TaxID=2821102 RepID=UPI001ADAAD73|nr:efflux RND transporter permease subunit [Tropicibacter sp. R16_0]MBO9451325.1 efflux RND transporter permease subunit [Tropicibacter sp. R16_0]
MKSDHPPGNRLFSFLFVQPILAVLLVLFITVGGIFAFRGMIKESLPDLQIPMAFIHTSWHGTPQSVMEREVTERIEREIRDLEDLKTYSSGSTHSNSVILAEFDADAPLESSISQLRDRVNKARAEFPEGAKTPTVTQSSIRAMPIASFVLHGRVPPNQLDATAKKLRKDLLRIPGITKVHLLGNRKTYVRVQMLPERLRAYDVSPVDVGRLIRSHAKDFPLGVYEGPEQSFSLKSETAIYDVDALADLVLRRNDAGYVIRLRDVARVEKALYRAETETFYSSQGGDFTQGVALSVVKADGQDTIKLVDRAKQTIEQAMTSREWPAGLQYDIVSNDAEIIQQELDKTLINGWQSVAAVFVVLFFLLSWREATIAALSIPITMLAGLAVLWMLGYTFNVMVVIGMVLALGLLVDDFILMMEGMHDGLQRKKLKFHDAAIRTVKQYAVPSLAGTVTTVLIFLPLAMIGGLDGKFIRSIPVTAAVLLATSYAVSLLISIPLSRFLLSRQKSQAEPMLVDRLTMRLESWLHGWLDRAVVGRRSRSWAWLSGGALIVAFSVMLSGLLPVTLYPLSDGRNMGITIELSPDNKLEETREVALKVGEILRDKPYLTSTMMVVGQRDFLYEGSAEDRLSVSTARNIVGFTVLYTPKRQRDQMAFQTVPALRAEIEEALAEVPGYRMLITSETGSSTNEDPLQINIFGPDLEGVQRISQQVQQMLRQIPGLSDIRDNLGQARVETTIKPKREVLERYGLTEEDFNAQLTHYLGDYEAAKMRNRTGGDDLEIRVETYWPSKDGKLGGPETWDEWKSIQIRTPDGRWVPVSLLAEQRQDRIPLTISRKDGQRTATIMGKSFSYTFGDLHNIINPELERMQQDWPAGYSYKFAGEFELAGETFGASQQAFVLAMLAVASVLVLIFRSFLQPAIILVTVVCALSGVMIGFVLFAIELSFPAVIGMIALTGIAVNDGIVLVDTMNRHVASGMTIVEAACQGAADRFRPIVSTTLTTMVGLAPLALADEAWRPLCLAIIFGQVAATIAALTLVPALFRVLSGRGGLMASAAAEPS